MSGQENTAIDAPGELFHVEKGCLRVAGDLYWEYLEEFGAACAKALESRRPRIELDLTGANFISSSFLGCIGGMVSEASHLGKRVAVKVTLDVSWLFDIMGGRENMDIEVV